MKTAKTTTMVGARLTDSSLKSIDLFFNKPTIRQLLESLIRVSRDNPGLRSKIINDIWDNRKEKSTPVK